MKRRRTFLLIFAILIMILVVGLIALWRSRGGGNPLEMFQRTSEDTTPLATPQPEATPEIETEPIVVALQTIPRGMTVPPDAVEIREWPKTDELSRGCRTPH